MVELGLDEIRRRLDDLVEARMQAPLTTDQERTYVDLLRAEVHHLRIVGTLV